MPQPPLPLVLTGATTCGVLGPTAEGAPHPPPALTGSTGCAPGPVPPVLTGSTTWGVLTDACVPQPNVSVRVAAVSSFVVTVALPQPTTLRLREPKMRIN